MKKITLLAAAVLVAMSAMAQVTVTTNWQKSDSVGTNRVWNSGDVTRGMAYGVMGGNERLFIATRHSSGTKVHVYNAQTGDSITSLNMTGVTGGTHVISDAGMTEDGKLLVSNMGTAISSTSAFKVYKWDNETAAPAVAISWAPTTATGRYGDKITVTGNCTTGTARVYAVMNVSATTKVKYWDMQVDPNDASKFIFNQDPKDLGDVANLGVVGSIGLRPDGGYYFKVNGTQIKQYTNTGVETGTASLSSLVASTGNIPKYIGENDLNESVICYLRYNTAASTTCALGNHKVDILRVNGNSLSTATVLASTPSLGKKANGNGAGGLVVNKLPNNDVQIYVLSTNNGFAKFTISGLFTTGPTSTSTLKEGDVKVNIRPNSLLIDGINPSSIELFNTLGQRVKSISNANEISTVNLHGIYIVKVKAEGKIVKATKISIK